MKKTKALALFLAAVLAAGSLTGCGGGASEQTTAPAAAPEQTQAPAATAEQTATEAAEPERTQGGTFVFPLNQDITSFNAIGTDVIPFRAIFDPLYIADEGEVRYYLADSYSVSDDGLEVTIKLKDNLKWHDGEPITADDILFSFQVASMSWRNLDGQPVQYEKVDDLTVKAILPMPNVVFPMKLGAVTIMPKHMFEGVTDVETYRQSASHQIGIGSGPYKVKQWNKGESIVLERFDDYYRGTAPFDTLIYKILPDENAREVAFQSGELSFKTIADELQYARYSADSKYDTYLYDEHRVNFVGFNKNSAITSDIRVRQAITYALNQDEIVYGAFGEHLAKPANSIFTPGNRYYDPKRSSYVQDVDKAKQLADECGLTGKTIKLIYDTSYVGTGDAALLIQEQLKAIGVTVEVQGYDNTGFNTLFFSSTAGDWEMGIKNYPSAGDNSSPAYMFKQTSVLTANAIISDETQALWVAAEQEFDPVKRGELYAQIDDSVDADYMLYRLSFPQVGIVSQKQFKGYETLTRSPMFEDWLNIYPVK